MTALKLVSDFRSWILLFFIIRLIGITNPPLEFNHNWRQVVGLMIARDLFEGELSVFASSGQSNQADFRLIALEFPILNFLHACVSMLFDFQHWYGRLINLLVSSFGLYFFYRLVRHYIQSSSVAYISSLLLASSIWFSFSRKMMPDTFSISLIFIGLWFGVRYTLAYSRTYLLLFFLFVSMGLLAKIPSILYLFVFLVMLQFQKTQGDKRTHLSLVSMVSLFISLGWYYFGSGVFSEDQTGWFSYGKSFVVGFKEIALKYKESLNNFTFHAFQGYSGSLLFISGVLLAIVRYEKRYLLFLLLSGGGFLLFIFKAGWFFYHHNYYIIPIVPVMSVFGGYALSELKGHWIALVFLGISISESLWNQYQDFFIPESEKYKLTLGGIMNQISAKNDLVIINGNGNPQLLYLAHRKGWSCVNWELTEIRHIKKIIGNKACKFIVIDRHANEELNGLVLPLKPAFENQDFRIYHTVYAKSGQAVVCP